jgi:bacillithiol biosynthesis cysteine-adding enzyme BshC
VIVSSSSAIRQAIDVRRFPWIRPLVGAYANDFASIAPLFAGNPADPGAWRATIARVAGAARDRSTVGSILASQLDRRGAPPAAKREAAKLLDPASVAIVTGQQAGVFGGPLYTLLKSVTAIQLARRVEAEYGVPAVPVFWVECEDHDWAEVRSTMLLDVDCVTCDISLADLPGSGKQPVSSLVLDAGVEATLQALEAVLPESEFRAGLLAGLRQSYKPGASMATAFAGWLDQLLGPHGMVVFEANDPAAKPLVADVFASELEHPARMADTVREAGVSMERLGHAPQVVPADDSTGLFYMDASGRRAIKRQGQDFGIGDTTRPAGALVGEARTHPERFSPNVLLRPLVQDRLFPTACYVGGPSELAYQAQLGGIYRAFGIQAPLLVSRVSATLLDSGAAKFLERSGVDLEALQPQDDGLLNRLLASLMPPELERALDEAAEEIRRRLATIHTTVQAVDPTLTGAAETTRDRMLESLKTLQGKIVQASKRKDDTLRRQLQRARALTFPGGHPQERAISLTFFVNRYGPSLVERLIDTLPLDTSKHYVLVI